MPVEFNPFEEKFRWNKWVSLGKKNLSGRPLKNYFYAASLNEKQTNF